MHTADGCCGQKEKQVQKSNWISGYFCVHCWSTKHQCPCSLKDRLKGQNGCKIAQNSGATKPQYNNPTVSPYQNFYISKLKKKSLNQLIDCPNIMISVPLKIVKITLTVEPGINVGVHLFFWAFFHSFCATDFNFGTKNNGRMK